MKDTTTQQVASPEAAEDIPFEIAPAFDLTAAIETARAAAMAEAQGDETPAADVVVDAPADTAAAETPAPAGFDALPEDEQDRIFHEQAEKRGYRAPEPPPEPFLELRKAVAPQLGWDGSYERLEAIALADIPDQDLYVEVDHPLKPGTRVTREEAQKAAKAELAAIKDRRSFGDTVYKFIDEGHWQQIRADLANVTAENVDRAALARLDTVSKIVDATATSVKDALNADWQKKWDDREREFRGQLAQKDVDRTEAARERVTRANAPDTGGGRAGPSSVSELFGGKGRLSESVIDRARRGEFAGLSLRDD